MLHRITRLRGSNTVLVEEDEKATPNQRRCTAPGNGDSVEAQPARASALRTRIAAGIARLEAVR